MTFVKLGDVFSTTECKVNKKKVVCKINKVMQNKYENYASHHLKQIEN